MNVINVILYYHIARITYYIRILKNIFVGMNHHGLDDNNQKIIPRALHTMCLSMCCPTGPIFRHMHNIDETIPLC